MTASNPGPLRDLPFTRAEITSPHPHDAVITYVPGSNCSGTGQHEVIMRVLSPDGGEAESVIMRGLPSRDKAAAIAMILNAPED